MLVLDTDHISTLGDPSVAGFALLSRLNAAGDQVTTTVVTVEENLQGWLAQIRAAKTPEAEINAYGRFQRRVDFSADWVVLPWDREASRIFLQLRSQKIRIGTQDLRIASISLACQALLLTRNRVDFQKVPGLKFENWLD